MQTGEALERVSVRRVSAEERGRGMEAPKGGQLMQERWVYTERDGRFELGSVRALGPFANSLWWALNLSFKRSGYEVFSARYAFTAGTNRLKGEPAVDIGEVRLLRKGQNGVAK